MTHLGHKCDSNDGILIGRRDSMLECYDMDQGGRNRGDADCGDDVDDDG